MNTGETLHTLLIQGQLGHSGWMAITIFTCSVITMVKKYETQWLTHKRCSTGLVIISVYTPLAPAPGAPPQTEEWQQSWWSCRLCGLLAYYQPALSDGLIRGPEEDLPTGRREKGCVIGAEFHKVQVNQLFQQLWPMELIQLGNTRHLANRNISHDNLVHYIINNTRMRQSPSLGYLWWWQARARKINKVNGGKDYVWHKKCC